MLRRASILCCGIAGGRSSTAALGSAGGNPLVPAAALREELDTRTKEADRREEQQRKALPRDVLPPKKYKPLSLRARDEVMRRESAGFEHVTVNDDAFGQRLDEFVMAKYPHLTYRRMQGMVEKGLIYRYRNNGKRRIATVTDRLERGEMVVLPPSVREEADTLSKLNTGRDGILEPEVIDDPNMTPRMGRDGKPARKRPPLSPKMREEAFNWVLLRTNTASC